MGKLVVASLLVLVGLMSSALSTAAEFKPAAKGTVYRDLIDLGNGLQVPLPNGDWLLIANQLRPNSEGLQFYRPVLADIREKVLHGIITIATAIEFKRSPGFTAGFVIHRDCGRSDIHFLRVFSNLESRDQDCWYVNHYTMTLGNKPLPEFVEATNALAERGAVPPINMIGVHFHFANGMQQYLDARYYFNPEADGFPPPQHGEWRSSDWHKDRVAFDPKKKEYIQGLVDWAGPWHDVVKQGFAGKLKADAVKVAAPTATQ